ncbi:MAG: hypothetical protein ACFB2W_25250 [Leptolyngbyaceae cyanobacterium]
MPTAALINSYSGGHTGWGSLYPLKALGYSVRVTWQTAKPSGRLRYR